MVSDILTSFPDPHNLILFMDKYLLVMNKPAGLLSQKDRTGDQCVVDILKLQEREEFVDFLAPVHRLDRNASGVLLLARDKKTAAALTASMKKKEISRTYIAVVKGVSKENGTIQEPIIKDEEKNQSYVSPKGKPATTKFHRTQSMPSTSLLSVELGTGRSHQIRVHLAHIGHPLLGDRKYGKKPWSIIFHRPALHASSLRFPHPKTGEEQTVFAELPVDMKELVQKLGGVV